MSKELKLDFTPELMSKLKAHSDKWIAHAMGTERCDRAKVAAGIRGMYAAAKEVRKLVPNYVDKLGNRGASVCIGPIVEANKTWMLTHPEHAHHKFPAGCYLTVYQLDRMTMREVRD